MICLACRERRHQDCKGRAWCDCQHQTTPPPREPATGAPGE
ncbi:hypothetical protein [Actinocatenispora thailandica]|nr:hypothetical protein [Actinocatenispora thailandica]